MADRIEKPRQIVHASDEHAVEPPLPAGVPVARQRGTQSESSPHSTKFRAATAVLLGLAVGAIIVALAVLSSGTNAASSLKWSEWTPPDSGTQGAREIAAHVAPLYRISGVDQLAVVTLVNLSTSSASAGSAATGNGSSNASGGGLQIAVRTNPASSAVSVLGGNTVAFNLCGIGGSNCAIAVGQPSANRLLLLRREALELALYTFKYISGIQNVVAILPPGHTSSASTLSPKPPSSTASSSKPVDVALLFLRAELGPWLSQPLSNTFPETFPPTVSQMASAPEAPLVNQITARGLFSERVVQAQDGSNLIVLDPLPPQ